MPTINLEAPIPSPTRPSLDFRVDAERCTACGLCVQDCPTGLLQDLPPRIAVGEENRCLRCQHCLAICPTGAISLEGRQPEASLRLPGDGATWEQLDRLVRGRRSIRQYRDADVDPELIQRLLASTAHAPTAVNARALTFTVVERREKVQEIRARVLEAMEQAAGAGRIPEGLGFLKAAPSAFQERGQDLIFRGAPHILVVSAPLSAPGALTDVAIALTTFELLAVAAGLGTVWCGMLRMALEIEPSLRRLLDLPAEGIHYYPLLFGTPAVAFARSAQRDDAAIVKRIA